MAISAFARRRSVLFVTTVWTVFALRNALSSEKTSRQKPMLGSVLSLVGGILRVSWRWLVLASTFPKAAADNQTAPCFRLLLLDHVLRSVLGRSVVTTRQEERLAQVPSSSGS